MASDSTVKEIISDLQKFYGKTLNKSQTEFYHRQLSELEEGDLCNAIVFLKGKELIFPGISVIRRHFYEVRNERWNREKSTAPDYEDLKRSASTSPAGKESIAQMIALTEGKITRQQYLEWFSTMEQKIPGVGWDKAYRELKAFWASEEKRHLRGRKVLERIWRLQDQNGFPTINNPAWYKPK